MRHDDFLQIRSPSKACVDESNCDFELYTLCAFAGLEACAPRARANAHTPTHPRSYTQKNRPFFIAGNTTLDTRVQFLSCWDEGSEARPHKKRIEPTRGTGQRLKGAVLQPSRIATVARECTVNAAAASRLHWSCRCKRLAATAGREPVVI